jgi:hypothetical protein
MSTRGARFLEHWLEHNVREVAFPQEHAEAEPLASRCIADAAQQHISEHELVDTVGDLTTFMFRAMSNSSVASSASSLGQRIHIRPFGNDAKCGLAGLDDVRVTQPSQFASTVLCAWKKSCSC